MFELQGGQTEDRSGLLLDWAGRHPGAVLLATLLVGAALLVHESTRPRPDLDQASDEVPLFV
jgi:hypothetical protein